MSTPTLFEWDEAKSAANEAERGIPFEAAAEVFLDDNRLESPDARFSYGESRMNVIGAVDGVVLHVTYTRRNGVARIISARRANRKERKRYASLS